VATQRGPVHPNASLAARACHHGSVAGEFEDLRRRLEAISEELADLAIARLRDSIDAGGHELPVDERLITRARRAVDKAAALLAQSERGSPHPDDS